MFIAHLPAGYLLATSNESRVEALERRLWFWSVVIGSILPDLDMFYFYLVDGRQTHHHLYWPHLPVVWVILLGGVAVIAAGLRKTRIVKAAWYLFLGVFLHLLLDTPVGGIAWLYPYNKELLQFIDVPAGRSWWVWNFVFHWTFIVEIAVCIAAIFTWVARRRGKVKSSALQMTTDGE